MEISSAERLRFWRLEAELTQGQLGELFGTHASAVCRMEAGTQRITSDQLETLRAHLGESPDRFYGPLPKKRQAG